MSIVIRASRIQTPWDSGRLVRARARHVRRAARIAQARRCGERLLPHGDPRPGAVARCAVEHPGQVELARGIRGARDNPQRTDEVALGRTAPWTGRGSSPSSPGSAAPRMGNNPPNSPPRQ